MDEQDDTAADAIEIRHATTDDLPAILNLAQRALGWSGGPEDAERFHWKHFENPFGASPMWIALDGSRVVGLRAFLRWRFHDRDGHLVRAVRAVDTATEPEYQGRGIFTRLTSGALDELRADGVQLVFNTPNARSLPGYRKMGWSQVGRLPVSVMLGRARSVFLLATARQPASRSSIDTAAGERACDVLADRHAIEQLLTMQAPPSRLVTASSAAYLSWRYGHGRLCYRVMLHGSSPADGLAVFRLRRRGRAVEAAICDVLVPEPDPAVTRSLLRRIARSTDASYLLRLSGRRESRDRFFRAPGAGPILACRRLDGEPVPALRDWGLVLGDVELL